MIQRPSKDEYADYYADYVQRVPDGEIRDILESQVGELKQVYSQFSEQQAAVSHKEGAWSPKEVLGHLNDTERLFSYRAWRISRGDQTPLAKYEQDAFVTAASFNSQRLSDLLAEFENLRRANLILYRTFSEEVSERRGTASGYLFSVRALMYVTAGHAARHLELLRERFGLK